MMKIIFSFLLLFMVSVTAKAIAEETRKHEIQLPENSILVIEQKRFDQKAHEIEYSGKGNNKVPFKIDGHKYFPNDFDLPYYEIVSLYLSHKGVRYDLDKSNIYDIGPKGKFTFVCSLKSCKLKIIYGDGAGVIMAEWEIKNGKSKRTLLTSDLEEIYG